MATALRAIRGQFLIMLLLMIDLPFGRRIRKPSRFVLFGMRSDGTDARSGRAPAHKRSEPARDDAPNDFAG